MSRLNKNQRLLVAAVASVAFLAACGTPPAAPIATSSPAAAQSQPTAAPVKVESQGVSVVDGTGATVTVAKPPQKIACLTSNCVDILADLGVEPYAVLTSDNDELARMPDYFGDKAAAFKQIGGGWMEPSIEETIAVQPDLIIGHPFAHGELYKAFEKTAPLYNVHRVESVDAAKKNVTDLGKILGREEQAKAAIENFDKRLKALADRVPENRLSAAVIEGSDANFTLYLGESILGQLFNPLLKYDWKAPEGVKPEYGSIPFSLEKLLEIDPDILFVHTPSWSGPADPLPKQFAKNPVWAQLKAVKSGRVYEVNGKLWHNNSGLRSFLVTVEQGLATAYPDVYKDRPGIQAAKY